MLQKFHHVFYRKPFRTLFALLVVAWPASAQELNSRLMDAARSQDTAQVKELLKEGADPNSRDKNGRTPLMESASEGYTQTVRALLENGADVNATDRVGWTALFWAAFSRRTEALRALVAHRADVNARDGASAALQATHLSVPGAAKPAKAELLAEARAKGYEGEACGTCGNFTLVRNGTCLKCDTCGGTTGCS